MAQTTTLTEIQPADRRKSPKVGNDRGCDTSPDNDKLMEQVLDHLSTTPQEGVLKKIASLPHIRRGKVLVIRRQIMKGTYEIAGRLDKVIDRILEAITD